MSWAPNIMAQFFRSSRLRRILSCATSSFEKIVPTWECQRHQGPFLHLGHHALDVLVCIEIVIVKIHTILTRSQQNREIPLGTYSEVLPHWTLDCDVSQSRVLSRNAPEKCGWLVMVGLYHHQLLILPRLIQKASPQLRMKPGARCCRWGHYRDPTTHFSTRLSQLLQGNPLDCFQFFFQWCFLGGYSCRLTHTLHRLHQHLVSYQRCRQDLDNFLLMFVEFAPNGVVTFNY